MLSKEAKHRSPNIGTTSWQTYNTSRETDFRHRRLYVTGTTSRETDVYRRSPYTGTTSSKTDVNHTSKSLYRYIILHGKPTLRACTYSLYTYLSDHTCNLLNYHVPRIQRCNFHFSLLVSALFTLQMYFLFYSSFYHVNYLQ